MRIERFTLTEQHILLLSSAYVGWYDAETGAPAIDPKRPYGNSFVALDVAELLGLPWPDENKLGPAEYDRISTLLEDQMLQLHRETQTALQIILQCKTFEPGTFELEDKYSGKWKRV